LIKFLSILGSDEVCESDLTVQAELFTKRKEGTNNNYMLYLGIFSKNFSQRQFLKDLNLFQAKKI
jgi:hypothetical protein